jgi:hypothetical protein
MDNDYDARDGDYAGYEEWLDWYLGRAEGNDE